MYVIYYMQYEVKTKNHIFLCADRNLVCMGKIKELVQKVEKMMT